MNVLTLGDFMKSIRRPALVLFPSIDHYQMIGWVSCRKITDNQHAIVQG